MSNEISITINTRVKNSNMDTPFIVPGLLFDQASPIAAGTVQSIGTSTNCEFVALGDVTTAGLTWFRNMDSTNYIDIGTGTGTSFVAFIRLGPGKPALCWLHPTNAPSAKANVAACNLWYQVNSA